MKHIRKAVFPVAGLGTRFLPATKAVPKEMLPIVDKPLVQYAVEEAVAAGCDTLVFVTNRYNHPIADHFDKAYELEAKLAAAGKSALLERATGMLPRGVSCVFVTQAEALGLGHAVLCARAVIGDDPFAVLLCDDLVYAPEKPCLAQMADVATAHGGSVVAVQDVPREHTASYGIAEIDTIDERVGRIRGLVEKPQPDDAPSTLGVVGRYVLNARIFELLATQSPGAGGEIQLTDAIARLAVAEPVFSYRFHGQRYDCGSKLGMVQATLRYALDDPEIADALRQHMATLT
ncbi:MAG TPA: UTP--glucose-1-phosphate uridylyltransferase GalU [Xanthomonadaceae bacterium]|nr:UTP--glucose-1-phosphate uridylyltransferase GalU [Xanthomonadaceae bacterium]